MSDYQKVEIKSDEAPAYQQEQVEQVEPQASPEAEEQFTPERPAWLPEKFESPEALAYAYEQLQKEFSQSRQQPQEVEEEPEVSSQFSEEVFMRLSEEFDATGDVSEDSRERLAQSGIPRAMIDNYVESQKIIAEQEVQSTFESVGGEDNYNAMLQWASNNLPDAEIDAFNEMINADASVMQTAVNGMYARFVQSQGAPLLQGETSNMIPNSGAFQSRAQVTEAMSDPRYKKDPAYRQQVYNRLQNSNVL